MKKGEMAETTEKSISIINEVYYGHNCLSISNIMNMNKIA